MRLQGEYEVLLVDDAALWRGDLLDHVWTRLSVVSSGCGGESRGAVSRTGVEGGVRGDASTSNWRER